MFDRDKSVEDHADRIRPETLDQLTEQQIRALADPYARATLRYLSVHSTATLSRLGDVVTGSESAATGSVAGPSRRESNLLRLHHTTLPRLDDCGLLQYDSAKHAVTSTEIQPAVSELLGRLE